MIEGLFYQFPWEYDLRDPFLPPKERLKLEQELRQKRRILIRQKKWRDRRKRRKAKRKKMKRK